MLKNKEIADILKISPAAVSLALNNKYGVSEDTRRKVIALRNSSMAADYNDLQRRELNAPQILFLVLKKHGFVISDTPFNSTALNVGGEDYISLARKDLETLKKAFA